MDMQSPQPRTWKELVSLKEILKTTHRDILREPEDNEYYLLFREVLPKDLQLELIKRQLNKDVGVILNRFPYTRLLAFLPHIRQYCLWSLKGSISESEIEEILNETFPHNEWFHSESKFKYVIKNQ